MGLQNEYNTREKAKARKSGPSLLSKTKELGIGANVFAFTVYFDPTYFDLPFELHFPEGMKLSDLPDVNKMIKQALSGEAPKLNRQRRRPPNSSQSHHAARPPHKVRRSARRRARESKVMEKQSTRQEVIHLNSSSDDSVGEASQDDGSESDSAESGCPSPTIEAESDNKQERELSRPPELNGSQVPNSTQDCARVTQTVETTTVVDNRGDNWGALTLAVAVLASVIMIYSLGQSLIPALAW
ncbi:hypothetical protein TrVFT333_006439 [Trichoderma virens FT-333]|nr:hypothetical protein TrVFT333_006439 [Trichoderma virens FT-333]